MPRVFISYSHNDSSIAQRIHEFLLRANISTWIDEDEILIGDLIISKLEAGISNSDLLLVVLTSNSVKSAWVKQEVEAKLGVSIAQNKLGVLPVIAEQLDSSWSIPIFLKSRNYADISTDFETGMADVIRTVVEHCWRQDPNWSVKQKEDRYSAFVLGSLLAKLGWFDGSIDLLENFRSFSTKLQIKSALVESVISSVRVVSNPSEFLQGLKWTHTNFDTLNSVIIAEKGGWVSAHFRFGFNLTLILPQLEFAATVIPIFVNLSSEFWDGLKGQLRNIIADSMFVGLRRTEVALLKESLEGLSPKNVGIVREKLISIGSSLEIRLRGANLQ